MTEAGKFKAVVASGTLIPSASATTAASILFEKIYLPNQLELVVEFAKSFRLNVSEKSKWSEIKIEPSEEYGTSSDPLRTLTPEQKITALKYLDWSMQFAWAYSPLYGEVFETDAFEQGMPYKISLKKKGKPGELNTYEVSRRPMLMSAEDSETFPTLLKRGYVPIVTHPLRRTDSISSNHSKTIGLASLLAMQAVSMVLPSFDKCHPELILEARTRLRDQLPPYWSTMLKLTTQLQRAVEQGLKEGELLGEATEVIDRTVRPALIDISSKLEKERKNWFYKILSPVQKGLRLLVGNPPISQQQLITSGLLLAADVSVSIADNMRTIESLKQDSGITFLLELENLTRTKRKT